MMKAMEEQFLSMDLHRTPWFLCAVQTSIRIKEEVVEHAHLSTYRGRF